MTITVKLDTRTVEDSLERLRRLHDDFDEPRVDIEERFGQIRYAVLCYLHESYPLQVQLHAAKPPKSHEFLALTATIPIRKKSQILCVFEEECLELNLQRKHVIGGWFTARTRRFTFYSPQFFEDVDLAILELDEFQGAAEWIKS